MWTAATAAGSTARSGWARRRMGSSAWLTWVEARQGWSLVRWTMVFSPGMSAAVTMVNSCQGMEGSKAMEEMRPRGMVLRTVAPNHMLGREISSIYWARPKTLAAPSLRGGEWPTIWGDSAMGRVKNRRNRGDVKHRLLATEERGLGCCRAWALSGRLNLPH